MAQNVRIECIVKDDRKNPFERIQHIGGQNSDGSRWKLSLDDAIAAIEADKWKFWTSVNNDSVWVEIAVSRFGNKYLKTQNDGDEPNNLLSLPTCP